MSIGLARVKLMVLAVAVPLVVGLYFMLDNAGYLHLFSEPRQLVETIRGMSLLGPVVIIGLMSIAIVVNPLPSAPIALAAGAIYGHTLGTLYIVAGAEIGAIVAFFIARWAGYELTERYFGETRALQRISSQNTLTLLVFSSRLVPFMSFDLVSYAAGLTPISVWRFALATLFGLIPVSFALAHFGSEIEGGDYQVMATFLLAFGLLTIAPILVRMFRARLAGRQT